MDTKIGPRINRVKFLVEKADDTLLLSSFDKNNNTSNNTNTINTENSNLSNEYIWEFDNQGKYSYFLCLN
jgi:hypothetical protein